ncbi:MAG: hypothetical protein ACE5EU_12975, partial [Paracoccaceae bacterium]
PTSFKSLSHPAGVTLPFDGPVDAELLLPEIRNRIVSGEYSADLLRALSNALEPADRVLVVGAGLGTASTLAAMRRGVERVVAVEASTELAAYLNRVHDLNGVPGVETLNAVLSVGKRGRVPFFARNDIRASSLMPDECSWQRAMMIPCMDVNLILAELRISLIVCEIPSGAAQLLEAAELEPVDRILISGGDDALPPGEEADVLRILAEKGFEHVRHGSALMFGRTHVGREAYVRAQDSA